MDRRELLKGGGALLVGSSVLGVGWLNAVESRAPIGIHNIVSEVLGSRQGVFAEAFFPEDATVPFETEGEMTISIRPR